MTEFDFQLLKQYSLEDSSLRDYQQEHKQNIYNAFAQHDSVMLQMPTGTGKTRLFVSLIHDLIRFGKEHNTRVGVLILVHRIELIEQIHEVLSLKYHLPHGFILSGEKEDAENPIQLASVQTLSRRLDDWRSHTFDLIIVDEAHHVTSDSYRTIIDQFPDAKMLGVTATPVRLNGKGFTDIFETLITSPSVKEFIDRGYLSSYLYFSVGRSSYIQTQIDGIRKYSHGDYAESELERICDTSRIRAEVVKTYTDFADGKKGIVYTINKLHNKNLCQQFLEKGISAVAIDSDTPTCERKESIEKFRRGEIKVICNVNLFSEGFDCPDIEFIQLARPTKSLALYLQQVGRGLRTSENKDNTIFLDNVGLYNRFKTPATNRKWRYHFEGRQEDYALWHEEESKLLCFSLNRTRNSPDLSEGHEEVHLIQTTDEKEHVREILRIIVAWMRPYIEKNIEAMNLAFDEIGLNGLALHDDFDSDNNPPELFFDIIHLYIKERTKEIRRYSLYHEFDFEETTEEGTAITVQRRCRGLNELILQLDKEFHEIRRNHVKSIVKEMVNDTYHFNPTVAEIYDAMNLLIHINPPTDKIPNNYDRSTNKLFCYFLMFFSDAHHFFKQRKSKILKCLNESLWDALDMHYPS